MAMVSFTMVGEITNQGFGYAVMVDEDLQSARLNISMEYEGDKANKKTKDNSQGMDLTAEECEVLGKHLIAVSKRLKAT